MAKNKRFVSAAAMVDPDKSYGLEEAVGIL
jgi:hypothetical protein